jgi:AraC-like DNA-binding protein
VELVVHFGEPFQFVRGGARERCPPACVAGLQTGPTLVESLSPTACVLGVQLHPLGAHALFDVPADESTGRLVNLDDLVGRAARELVDKLSDLPDAESRVRGAADWVWGRILRAESANPLVVWSVTMIERMHGSIAIADLEHRAGVSKRRLVQQFREHIGVTPKAYARIVRVRRALALLHDGTRSLADVAVAAGYHDQPHMNLEFRELVGCAPGQFLAADRWSATTLTG